MTRALFVEVGMKKIKNKDEMKNFLDHLYFLYVDGQMKNWEEAQIDVKFDADYERLINSLEAPPSWMD